MPLQTLILARDFPAENTSVLAGRKTATRSGNDTPPSPPEGGHYAQRWSEATRENLGRPRHRSFDGNRPRKARNDLGRDFCCSRRARTNPVPATKSIWLLRTSRRDLTTRRR